MTGYKTLITGALLAIVPPLTSYVEAINWDEFMSPTMAFFVSGIAMMALRFVTNTGVFKGTE
jgi:hypothetical protein